MLVSVTFITRKCSVSGEGRLPVTRCTFRIGARLPNSRQAAANRRLAAHSACAANEVDAFAGERGGSLAVPRKPSFWRSQGRLCAPQTVRRARILLFAIILFISNGIAHAHPVAQGRLEIDIFPDKIQAKARISTEE